MIVQVSIKQPFAAGNKSSEAL